MRERLFQLDLLRSVAIIAVLIAHTSVFRDSKWNWEVILRPSWTGVDLFFVLSGFLISGLLFSEFQKRGRIDFKRFAIRRALKIYPVFYVLIVLVLIYRLIHVHFHDIGWILGPFFRDVFFVQSYFQGTYGIFWSLSVEEHFYILLPLTLFFLMRRATPGESDPFRPVPVIFLAVAVFCLIAKVLTALLLHPFHYQTHLYPTHLRLDALLFGVVICYWSRFHHQQFSALITGRLPLVFLAAAVLISPAFLMGQSDPRMYSVGLTSLYLGYGMLMIGCLQIPFDAGSARVAILRPLAYIGRHSYPIYVFHIAVIDQLKLRGFLQGPLRLPVYFVSCIVVGIVVSKIVEVPALRLRERLFPASRVEAAIPETAAAA